MAQNRSTAVMNSRIDPMDSLDHFPTPPWATRALCRYLERTLNIDTGGQRVWEPSCAEGYMARALKDSFSTVYASDIHDYGIGARVKDFTLATFDENPEWPGPVEWLIFNPPFNIAEEFILTALSIARVGVAVFVRTSFLETSGRHRDLFKPHPPAMVLQFTERVLLLKGKLRSKKDINPKNGKKYSTATAYCWIIWTVKSPKSGMTYFDWIPPCERELTRDEDYYEGLLQWK